jgi:hypothetical protein
MVLGLELRANTLSHSTSPIFVMGVLEIGSCKLFARTSFKPRFSWSLPPLQAWAISSQFILRFFLTHFELILEQGERLGSSFSLLQVDIKFSQHHLLKRLSFLQYMFWAPLSKIKLTVAAEVWVWNFYSVPLVFMSVFVPVPGCFYYCDSVA